MDWASGRLSRGAAARFLRKSRAVFRSLFFSTKRKFSFLLILPPQRPHSALAFMPLNFRRTTRLLDENRQGPEERLAHARKKHTVKLKGIEIKRPARRAATTFYFLRFIFSLRRPPRKRSYLSGGSACPFLNLLLPRHPLSFLTPGLPGQRPRVLGGRLHFQRVQHRKAGLRRRRNRWGRQRRDRHRRQGRGQGEEAPPAAKSAAA